MSQLSKRTGLFPSVFEDAFFAEPFKGIGELWGRDPAWMALAKNPLNFTPAFELTETPEAYALHADLPGMKESEVEVEMQGNALVISGKRELSQERKDEKTQWHIKERSYGSFTRTFNFGDNVDASKITAALKDGVLNVTVPKAQKSPNRKITVASKA